MKPKCKLTGKDANIFNLMGIASNALKKAGFKKEARKNKELVDEISATIILQDWMRSKK